MLYTSSGFISFLERNMPSSDKEGLEITGADKTCRMLTVKKKKVGRGSKIRPKTLSCNKVVHNDF